MEPYVDDPSRKSESLSPFAESEIAAAKNEAEAKTRRRQKVRRVFRVLHGLTLLVLVVYVASRYVSFPSFMGCHHNDKVAIPGAQRIGHWDYDVPKRTQLIRCATPEQWEPSDFADDMQDSFYPSEVSFDLPLDSAKLFLLARGQQLGGKVTFVTSEDQAQDQAKVTVKIKYNSEDALDWVKVCLLESAHNVNESGVGVFTPIWGRRGRWPDWKNRSLSYAITVTLPMDPVRINSFETDLPNTSHFLESLENVAFNTVNLRGTNGVFQVESLTTLVDGSIHTTNGKISGRINATDFLALMTTNSPVDVDVNFTNSNQGNATLGIQTTNSPLKASISLLSAHGTGDSFYITTATTNGPLAVDFPKSPVDSVLKLGASTTNSPAKVSLDAAYEGSFSLHTSRFFEPTLYIRPDEEDPSGKGRTRITHSMGGRGEVSGVAQWGTEENGPQLKGAVIVTTSNAPLALEL